METLTSLTDQYNYQRRRTLTRE